MMILFFGKRIRILPDHRHHSAHIIFLQERKGVGVKALEAIIECNHQRLFRQGLALFGIIDQLLSQDGSKAALLDIF